MIEHQGWATEVSRVIESSPNEEREKRKHMKEAISSDFHEPTRGHKEIQLESADPYD